YKFDPKELTEHVRGLFRADYGREVEDVAACQRVVLRAGENEGRSGSLVVQAAALQAAIPAGSQPMSAQAPSGTSPGSGTGSSPGQAVPPQESTAPVSIPQSPSDEMQVPSTQTGMEGIEGTRPTNPSNP